MRRLIKDDNDHWYLIPWELQESFWDWLEKEEEGLCEWHPVDFNQYSIDGPHCLKIKEWEVVL